MGLVAIAFSALLGEPFSLEEDLCLGLFAYLLVFELLEVVGFEEMVFDLFERHFVFLVKILR